MNSGFMLFLNVFYITVLISVSVYSNENVEEGFCTKDSCEADELENSKYSEGMKNQLPLIS